MICLKKYFYILLFLFPSLVYGVAGKFISINSSNALDQKVNIELLDSKEDPGLLDITVRGITHKHVWLFTTDKPLASEDQKFRSYIWKQEFEKAKVIKAQKIFSNRSKKDIKDLPVFTIRKDLALTSYIYMDHPVEIEDGSSYYSIDLPTFYQKIVDAKEKKEREEQERLAIENGKKTAKKKN